MHGHFHNGGFELFIFGVLLIAVLLIKAGQRS
jgi:hypothetical protein